MTECIITVTPETSLPGHAHILEPQGIKRVPVIEDSRVIGIVSRANLVQALAWAEPMRMSENE